MLWLMWIKVKYIYGAYKSVFYWHVHIYVCISIYIYNDMKAYTEVKYTSICESIAIKWIKCSLKELESK